MLRTLLNSASAGTLLLLKDIDAAFTKQRAVAAAGKESQLTFSGDAARYMRPRAICYPRTALRVSSRYSAQCLMHSCTLAAFLVSARCCPH